ESFGQLQKLKDLYLLSNQLNSLPESFEQLQKLRSLELSDNPLQAQEIEKLQKRLPNCNMSF
ncbi:MAG: hypothetical protein AAF734_04100, partial [Bacteroidota bacterium]